MKINVRIKHIFEGIKNSIFVKEEVEKIAKERYEFCKVCPKNSSNKVMGDLGPYYTPFIPEHCTVCACNLHAKVRSLHSECPLDPPKWEALSDQEVGLMIDEVTENTEA